MAANSVESTGNSHFFSKLFILWTILLAFSAQAAKGQNRQSASIHQTYRGGRSRTVNVSARIRNCGLTEPDGDLAGSPLIPDPLDDTLYRLDLPGAIRVEGIRQGRHTENGSGWVESRRLQHYAGMLETLANDPHIAYISPNRSVKGRSIIPSRQSMPMHL